MRLSLYIDGRQADIDDGAVVAVTKTYESLTNPTNYYSDFSKTVTLPTTKRNNEIFSNFRRLDSVVTNETIEPTKKILFTILDNGEMVMQGHLQLDNADTVYDDERYEVTLYSTFGLIMNELKLLTFNRNVTDLDEKYIIDTPFGDELPIDRNLVKRSFEQESHNIDSDDVIDWIGFIPTYQGRYSEFSSDKVQLLPSGRTDDMTQERDEHYTREFRSYYQQPFIWVDKLWRVAKDKIEDITDYTLKLDKGWFSINNPYYSDLIYTCPSLFNGDGNYRERSEVYKEGLNTITHTKTLQSELYSPSGITLRGLEKLEGSDIYQNGVFNSGSDYGSTVFKCKTRVTIFSPYVVGNTGYAKISRDNPFYLRVRAVHAETGETVGGAVKTYLLYSCKTDAGQHTYDEAVDLGVTSRRFPDLSVGVNNRLILNGQYVGSAHASVEGYYWETELEFSLNVSENVPYRIVFDVYNANNGRPFERAVSDWIPRWDWLWTDFFYSGDDVSNSDKGYSMYFDLIECEAATTENLRSGSGVSIYRVFPKDTTLCDVLLNYTKMFGLVWAVDEYSKTVTVMSRNAFYSESRVKDWTDKVDRGLEFKFTPLSFDKRFVEFGFESGDCGRLEKYQTKYEHTYGSKTIDTGYEFNNETNELLKGLTPSVVCQKRQYSRMMNTEYEDRPDFKGYNHMVYPDEVYVDNDNEGSSAGMSGAFYFRNGTFAPDPELSPSDSDGRHCVLVTDDTTHQIQTQTYCWNQCGENTTLCYRLPFVSTVSNLCDGHRYSVHFESPMEYFFQVPDGSVRYIYGDYWENYINERYGSQNKKLTAFFHLSNIDFADIDFREFVRIDNLLYHIDKVQDHNLNSSEPTKVELVQVWDLGAYTDGQFDIPYLYTSPDIVSVTVEGCTLDVFCSGDWIVSSSPEWLDAERVGDAVSVTPNSVAERLRFGSVRLSMVGSELEYSFLVSQVASGCYLSSDKGTIVFKSEGGTSEVIVDSSDTSLGAVSIATSAKWIGARIFEYSASVVDAKRGLHLYVTALPNTSTSPRSGFVTLTLGCGASAVVNVGQQAGGMHTGEFTESVVTDIEEIAVLDSGGLEVTELTAGVEYHFKDLFPEEIELDSVRMTYGIAEISGKAGEQTVVFTPQMPKGDTVGGGVITAVTVNGKSVTYNYNITTNDVEDKESRTVRIKAGDGGIFKVTVGGSVEKTTNYFDMKLVDGTSLSIEALPDTEGGYTFVRWVDGDGNEYVTQSIDFTVSASTSDIYTAEFGKVNTTVKVTITTNGFGTFTIGNDAEQRTEYTAVLPVGTTLTNVLVTPNEGYTFKQWSDGSVTNGRDITLFRDTSLSAVFIGGVDDSDFIVDATLLLGESKMTVTIDGGEPITAYTGGTALSVVGNGAHDIEAECVIGDGGSVFDCFYVNDVAHYDNPLKLYGYEIDGDTVVKAVAKTPTFKDYFYVEDISGGYNTLNVIKSSDAAPTVALYTSTDQTKWTKLGDTGTNALTVRIPTNGRLYLKSVAVNLGESGEGNIITAIGNHAVGGNIMSLIYGDDFEDRTEFTSNETFCKLFSYSGTLVDAGRLVIPVTSVGQYDFAHAFDGCYKLTTVPDFSNVTTVGDGGFSNAFRGCSALTAPPDFSSVTSVGGSGFAYAFENCFKLTESPDFSSVTTVGESGFANAFYGCSELTEATGFNGLTSVGISGFANAFENCTALTAAPDFSSVTIVGENGFYHAFQNCSALATAPDFSSVASVYVYGFASAFRACTSLATAPDFSNVTSVGGSGFANAFYGCSALTEAPDFSSVTSVGVYAFEYAFKNCTSLNTAYAPDIDIWDTSIFSNWLYNVASEGTLNYNGVIVIPTDNPSGCPIGWNLYSASEDEPVGYFYVEDRSGADNTFSVMKLNSSAPTVSVMTSTDQTNWTVLGDTSTTELTATIPANGRLYLKSAADTWGGNSDTGNIITASGNYAVGGNIMSLIYGDDFEDKTEFTSTYTFRRLLSYSGTLVDAGRLVIPVTSVGQNTLHSIFRNCTALTTPPDFSNVTTVGEYGLYSAFINCRALTTPPDFSSVTTVGNRGFEYAFAGCSTLTTPPDFSNVTTVNSYAFSYAFSGCTALTTPPDFSGVTTVSGSGFYRAFQKCSALTTPPDFSNVTTVYSSGFQEAFYNCSALTTPPDFSNVTTVGVNGFYKTFENCSSLTTSPDFRKVTTVGSWSFPYLFKNCTSLTTVYAPNIATWEISTFAEWLYGVASNGVLYYNGTTTDIPTDSVDGCPSYWTLEVYPA